MARMEYSLFRFVKNVLFFSFFFSCHGFIDTQENNLFDVMARDNLKTLTRINPDSDDTLNAIITHNKKFYEVLKDTLKQQRHLLPETKRRFVYTLLSQYEKLNPTLRPNVLDTTSWQDLELLSGPKSNLSHYLAAKIDRTSTEIGRVLLFKRLILPRSDVATLINNQAIIKELVENEELFNNLDRQLKKLQKTENIILSFWEEDIFQSILKQDASNIPYAPKASDWLNKSPSIIELLNSTRLISTLGTNLYLAIGTISLPLMGTAILTEHESLPALEKFNQKWGLGAMSILSVTGLFFYLLKQRYEDNKILEGTSHIVGGPLAGMNVLYLGDYLRGTATFKQCLQSKLIYSATYINALKSLSIETKTNALLLEKFPVITKLDDELKTLSKKSKEIKQLLGLLETNTFLGKPRFFSLYGRMYVAYNLLHKMKNELVYAMIAAGELDAYMSCARLIKEFKSKKVSYCFPEYITDASKPFVSVSHFWNPAINPLKAVPSSITIGKQNRQNIIVTGPNAGGKSTILKGLIINIIMAQSLGIASGESMQFTPFKKIMTYLNITDDIAAGNSHFKAGVLRARKLMTTASNKTKGNFSFTAVDEVFNGTSFKEGQAAAYALIEQLGQQPNNMCATVTHFPKIAHLENRTPYFSNYKVTVIQDHNGAIHYPYKLQPGISNQAIALDILKQEGFGDTFLDKAHEILIEQ